MWLPAWRPTIVTALLAVLLWANAIPTTAHAAAVANRELSKLFPGETGALRMTQASGTPPVHEVWSGDRLLGYAFSSFAVTGSLGFAGRPLDVHVGLTTSGRIAGALLAQHEEPILVIGVSSQALEAYVQTMAGINIRQPVRALGGRGAGLPDHVAGATVSSAVIKDAVLRSARVVAAAQGIIGSSARNRRIDRTTFAEKSFQELLDIGAVARQTVKRSDIAGPTGAAGDNDVVLDLFVALLTPPTIGQNLLGRRPLERIEAQLAATQSAILIAANGLYSFKGTAWRQSGSFEKFQIVQGTRTIRLTAASHENVERLAAGGAPEMREIGVFRLPPDSGFDAASPWRLDVQIDPSALGKSGAPQTISVEYRLPDRFFIAPAKPTPASPPPLQVATDGPNDAAQQTPPAKSTAPPAPRTTPPPNRAAPPPPAAASVEATQDMPELWEQIWRGRKTEIALTLAVLLALAVILFSHDWLVRDVLRYRRTRMVFLSITVLFLGLYCGAQLSVIHVITFMHALLSGFRWEQFLLDPLIFILWSFVAVALLFWGRGVFCGWLCPFGALQELLNEAARKLGIRQIEVPWTLHERLWPIKYVAFLMIVGISLKSATQAFMLAEVEPFKTAIVLKFVRAWPFVLYVAILLACGLFIERFYCRYLCPLGAALAIPARLRLFEWLKRRPQCGRECRTCATRCTVQAINPLGQIVPNECIYCLQCQANYYDPTTCLPLIQRAQRRRPTTPSPMTQKSEATRDE